jgi:spore coat polysaccharide biosynthesis predicted glycosyltransferase SpsG
MASAYRIIFVNEASSRIGMGHILRSLVLVQKMLSLGCEVLGITVGDEKAVAYAQKKAKESGFNWPVFICSEVGVAIREISKNNPHIVVVDCNFLNKDFVLACADLAIPVVALDYFHGSQPLPNAIINLIDHNEDTLIGNPPKRIGSKYLEGPDYGLIRDEFLIARKNTINKIISTSIRNILIAFGGADPMGNTKHALDMINEWPSEFTINLIVGPLFQSEVLKIAEKQSKNNHLKILVTPTNIGELFEKTDLIFCGGGGTLLESMCVGVPAIVFAQNDPEQRHAKSFADRNACFLAEAADWDYISLVENRKKTSLIARECVDGLGAERISNIISEQVILQERISIE